MRRYLLLLILPLLAPACAPLVVTSVAEAGISTAENRSVGRKVDDKVLYANVTAQYLKADRPELLGDVNINTRFARVMLTGRVKSEAEAQEAVALAWKAEGIEEVINELVVDPDSSNIWNTASDALVKRNIEARLLITKDVWVINYSFDVQNGVAYIIGRVKDQTELTRALNVVRTTRGVKSVVSHLQINPDPSIPTQPADINDSVTPAPLTHYYVPPAVQAGPVSQESTRPVGSPAPDSVTSSPVEIPSNGY